MSRLFEPSTWAGFAAILEAAKLFFPMHALTITAFQAAAGAVAVAVREGNNG